MNNLVYDIQIQLPFGLSHLMNERGKDHIYLFYILLYMAEFVFRKYSRFSDGEIDVYVETQASAIPAKGWVPTYHFKICRQGQNEKIGRIDLRIGYTTDIVLYGGHIGYAIDEQYRGHGYVAKACRLLKPVAVDHHLDVLWITCDPKNIASRKTCTAIGCEFVEIVDLPPENEQFQRGERQKCRYRWIIFRRKEDEFNAGIR